MRVALTILCALLIAPTAAGAAEPYWSLLGVGQGETVNGAEFGTYAASGEPPASFVNQRDMFNQLLYEAPGVRTSELGSFFKPAPLDPPAGSTEASPAAGVTIARDSYNVPYIRGETRANTSWGIGWASAEDRLFFMDVLRHTARSKLTELAGPGVNNVNLEADVAQLSYTDYDDSDLSGMLERLGRESPEGAQVVQDLRDYTAGVNAYIAATRTDASLLPAEYPALAKTPTDWALSDSVAILGLLNGYFGLGGGGEANVAMALREAEARFGRKGGARVLNDFRSFDDPEAPVVTTKVFPFGDPESPRAAAIARLDRGSLDPVDRLQDSAGGGGGALLQNGLQITQHASNAIVIPGRESKSGNPLLVAGPQVDFYSPSVFMEMAATGPGIRTRGVGVAGVGPYALIGRGEDFAWSITTAQGDLADEVAEELCELDGSAPTLESDHYMYKGQCRPFEKRTRELSWAPGPADLAADPSAQAGSWTVNTELSAHGPIVARATVRGKPVAIAFNRSSYLNEGESAVGFMKINDPEAVDGPRDFMRAAGSVTGSYNFFYADKEHAAYVQSGLYPRRAEGTDPSLPAWGTGDFEWRGNLGYRRLPKVVDPKRGYIVSWNNKQAPGWRASDADWQYGSVHRSQRLEKRVRSAIRGKRKLDLGKLVGIMGDAGTVDVRGQSVLPWLLRVIGKAGDRQTGVKELRAWVKNGAHRRDMDKDNVYDESYAVALMDAWWEPMTRAVFEPALGKPLFDSIAAINPVDSTPRQGPDTWYYGWMGYVQKDMRALLKDEIAQPPSRVYCGKGSMKRCRTILLTTLHAAVKSLPAEVKVPATCAVTEPPSCDQLDFIVAGAVETPPIPWQDRGSFQQAAEPGAG